MTDKPELTDRVELKPCPFCGKAGNRHPSGIGCMDSDCAGFIVTATPDEWNRRALSGGVGEPTDAMMLAGVKALLNNGADPECCAADVRDVWKAMLAAAPASPEGREWISVDERTPDTQYDVLITDGKFVGIGDCCKGHLWNIQSSINGPVTHWMPLPPAPTGAKERA